MTDRETLSKYLRKVTGDLRQARQRIEELEAPGGERIAIVAMSCRYPGGVRSPADLWRLLAAGTDAISAFPEDRGWDLERLYDPDPANRGTSYVREGGFLDAATDFDADFFGISPREALAMDPQQRVLLEASWEAFENAGLDPASLRGTRTGVFAGVMHHEYEQGFTPDLEGYRIAGGSGSVVSGRVAYTLGLEGPAVSVDTACSSSLVAMHLAAQALREGECDLALAGGVTVMARPIQFVEISRQRGLAADGRCKPFDAAADGIGWSEGVGLLVLERLSDAERNGHQVLATIRGSATNQDGASNGLTAPNGPSQERVIRQALASAGLAAGEVDAVEAHGTGTPLGDPIEAGALLETYGQRRDQAPLALGSIKSNLGHTQAAAGVASVIKMVLALQNEELPKTLHLDQPTPHVDWSVGELRLLAEAEPWERQGRPRRAGVSSFGVSGTNAHVILEEAPEWVGGEEEDEEAHSPPLPAVPLLLSAKKEDALREQALRLDAHLRQNPDLDLADVGFSLCSRAQFEHRAAVVGSDREEFLAALSACAQGQPHAALAQARAAAAKPAFLFSGHGSQWPGMAAGLLDGSPPFAARLGACAEALEPYLGFSVVDLLCEAEGTPPLARVDVVQTALFAVAVSLAELWRHYGVEPAAVIGHSVGEIAAACVAGALSLEDAARVVACRGQALTELSGKGAMGSISLPAERVRELIEPWSGSLSLAVVNAPSASVVSGEPEALAELLAACEAEGVRARKIPGADSASHSHQMEAAREQLLGDLAPIRPRSVELPFYSAHAGGLLDGAELGPEYWYRALREPVRFEAAVRAAIDAGLDAFLELSPHPVLNLAVQETAAACADPGAVATIGSLRRDEGGLERFALSLAAAHVRGVEVDWPALFADRPLRRVPLPTYAFQGRRYWLAPPAGRGEGTAIGEGADHPLLGSTLALAGGEEERLFAGRLSLRDHPWVGDHVAFGTALLPGTAFVELALYAGEQVGAPAVEELTIEAPLVLPEQGSVQVQLRVGEADAEGRHDFSIHSRAEGAERPWTRNASGRLGAEARADAGAALAEWPPAGAEPLAVESFYDGTVADLGIDYGPAFQCLRAAWRRGEELFVEVELGPEQGSEAERFAVHPALLDAAIHSEFLKGENGEGARAPFAWRGVRSLGPSAPLLRVRLAPADGEAISLNAFDSNGAPVLSVESLLARPISAAQLSDGDDFARDSLFRVEWPELAPPEPAAAEVEIHDDPAALLAAIAAREEAPQLLLCECRAGRNLDPLAATEALCGEALALLQTMVTDPRLAETRLALITRGAMALGVAESPDPAGAALWGLVRSAQAEHPDRFLLVDSDGTEASVAALAAVLEGVEEPQLALREGVARAPRLARVPAQEAGPGPGLDPEGSVLITGGTGALGAFFARHLVREHGVRHLVLTSRSGPEAPGAAELAAELGELGAEVTLAACDVAERAQLEELLAAIPADHPLTAVFHAAAVFDNALIESLTPQQLSRVLAVKAGAAWHLHELTAGLELAEFVLFSSGAGTFNNPGQGNYAAANSFLDALAQRRRLQGLAATSIAWGFWDREKSKEEEWLVETDRARLSGAGFVPMPAARGLELFDRIRGLPDPFLVAASLDFATLRKLARTQALPPLLAGLVRVPARRAAGSLAARLASLPAAEREGAVLELVREHAAAILGHPDAAAVEPGASFKDLGFDSLGAVELRNRLAQATGLRLPATLVFDYPSAAAAAGFLLGEVEGRPDAAPVVRASAAVEEPIAIVGMSCRFPGGVSSPEDLWRLLAAGVDAVSPFPADRGWDLERVYDPDPHNPGTSYARDGGFLLDAAEFDAEFFGISPREALATDPQQRLMLEAAWEAIEDAGIDPAVLQGSRTGVFAGLMHHDYGLGSTGTSELGGPLSSGSAASGRVAYNFGLEGPAVTVDTACSSSLVAMHLAGQALRAGECDLALAGGVAVLATPTLFVDFSRQLALSPDGRCKAFAAAADGVGCAEGVGLLMLERLSDAERNGHEVLALIRGSATNQDGASNGPTAPNGPSQERVIRQALANAGLAPDEVDAVEAHGTGTTLGDPIEAQAILATYGQGREEVGPLWLGSVKSNIGHTQTAAGVAGVIKMVLALRHGELPPTLHVDAPTPHVDWSAGAVELLSEPQAWERNGRPRRAGVSSFGASGTNAHLVLEEAPGEGEPVPGATESAAARPPLPATPLLLSAKSDAALAEQAGRLAACLHEQPDLALADVGYSLAASRASLRHRAAAIGSGREELLGALDALAQGEPHAGLVTGKVASGKLAYLFSGQGAQRAGMGRGLYEAFPAFATALDEVCAELDPHLERPLKDLLFAPDDSPVAALLDRTEFTQPALFAIEASLFRLLESWGMKPGFLIGHSIGELAAAHVAGVFGLADACKLIAARGALMGALPEGGAMVAIEASEEELLEEGLPEGLALAGVNGPRAVVASGEEGAALALAEAWKAKGRKATRLRVSHAFHSALMEPMLEGFAEAAASIAYNEPQIPVISNLTGEPLSAEQATDPAYWAQQVRQPVRFQAGVEWLAEHGATSFLELGPDAALSPMAAACLADREPEPTVAPLLRRERPEARALLGALAAAHVGGAEVDWKALFGERGAKRVPLPTYPFQRRRYWIDPREGAGDVAMAGLDDAEHPLLAAAVSMPDEGGWLLTGRLSLRDHPWLADHAVLETTILPGAAFVEMALRAAELAGAEAIEELMMEAPLPLPERGAVQVRVSVGALEEGGARSIAIHSRLEDPERPDAGWTRNAVGSLTAAAPVESEGLPEWPPPGAEALAVEDFYADVAELGAGYGPAFQGLKAAWRRGEDLFAEVELAPEQAQQAERYAIHPALLDAALHPALLTPGGVSELKGPIHPGNSDTPPEGRGARVPFAWSGVCLSASGASALRVRLAPAEAGSEGLELLVADGAGAPVARAASIVARPISPEQLGAARLAGADSLFELGWAELELPEAAEGEGEEARRFVCAPGPGLDRAAAAQALCAEVLAALQGAIAGEGRLAFITRGAVALGPDESPDPAGAAVWGLVRSAQAEHPGRFLLVDSDGSAASEAAITAALAQAEEPQLALREGVVHAPRLARASARSDLLSDSESKSPIDPEGTTLITGGTGALGALFARHLVEEHGARHLLLASRRGPAAPGADELVEALAELGAKAEIVACDATDRSQLAALIEAIPSERPLTAALHCAGVTDDGLIDSLDPARLAKTMAPKADAAWHLHELTRERPGCKLVLFSSAAATIASPGQGNYAAANAFLDALAQARRAEGLPALALAWGSWGREGGDIAARLGEADRARLARRGVVPLTDAEGLGLFDRALGLSPALFLPLRLDTAALRESARAGTLAPLLSTLVRVPARHGRGGALASGLAAMPEAERERAVAELVRTHVAAVLGHPSAAAVDPEAPFKDLGFDSLAAVELRNRLGQATGLQLPATLVFDYPSTEAVAGFVLAQVAGTATAAVAATPRARAEEPIAIVGMSCRYPGGVGSPEQLWSLVASGTDAISGFPEDRGWDLERIFDPDPDHPGTSYCRHGGFLADAAEFDAEFFGISPREARVMDPQQRLLLEAAWEAIEDGGIDPGTLAGSATGVFAGLMHHDYALGGTGTAELGGQQGAVAAGSVVSGRVAYSLGLEGPAITVDTACSSSLVAIHLAAQALRGGECTLALAGGVTVMATPGSLIEFSHQRALAADGRCKSYSEAADGTGFSEGVGVVLLERLSDAERNGHEVLATIRGSATNQDGASNGLTAPNGPAQERVIRQALANAGLAPDEVDAVEGHGTATALGDPIEAGALLATYGQGREEVGPLHLGSVKSNLGHTQAAAGVAGVIKMTLALRHEELPPTLHVDAPTPHVDWSAGAVELLSEPVAWEPNGRPRRAGVSSFGISGTNAHLILEEAPMRKGGDEAPALGGAKAGGEEAPPPGTEAATRPSLFVTPLLLSAKGEGALAGQAARLAEHLRERPSLALADVAHSLAASRASLPSRAAVLGGSRGELLAALDALAGGEPHPGLASGKARPGKLAYLFSGQGAQRPGMGRELYEAFPAFAAALDEICAELDLHLKRPLRELLFADEGSKDAALLGRTELTQPALFAIEASLFRLLESWGMKPGYLIGHSIGELAAAHVAGVFGLADACKLIAARGALMGALPEGGAMVAIEASEEELLEEGLPEGLSLAAVNGPRAVVASGEEGAALELAEAWKAKGRKATRLRVSHAFHSALMEPMLEGFAEAAASISYNEPQIPVISNLTGEPLSAEQATDPAYWVAQVRQPVRFMAGVDYLGAHGATSFLELGPDAALSPMAAACLAGVTEAQAQPTVAPLLRRDRAEPQALISALATAHVGGAEVGWGQVFAGAKRVPLPTYPFQRRRYWVESAAPGAAASAAAIGQGDAEHPLLGAAVSLPGGRGWLFTGRLSLQSHPWLADHAVLGGAVLPSAAFIELALCAAAQVGAEAVAELTIEAPLPLPERGAVQLQLGVGEAAADGSRPLTIHSRPEDPEQPEAEWRRNAVGALAATVPADPEALGECPPAAAEPLAIEDFYERAAELGFDYGPAFQGLQAAWRHGEELFAKVELAAEQAQEAERFAIHPALLDAALHPALLTPGGVSELKGPIHPGNSDTPPAEGARLPVEWNGVRLGAAGASELLVRLSYADESTIRLVAADADGSPILTVESLATQPVSAEQLEISQKTRRDSLFGLTWTELELPQASEAESRFRRFECAADSDLDPAAAAQALCADALAELQAAISEDGRLAFLTHGAVAVGEAESPDPAAAAVWGLVRSAQAEHPGRFLLLDSDGSEASEAAVEAALVSEGEPQLALREGTAFIPRLAPASGDGALGDFVAHGTTKSPIDPADTVLITGASGALGSFFARHLAAEHGEERVVVCEASDRDQLAELIESIPAERPLAAVFHCAGVSDDGVIESLGPERLAATMAPKADVAWQLHELTREIDGCELIFFSSVAGSLGSPGQGNYAAANAFLDALAQRRRAEGLPALALGWGRWEREGELAAGLSDADRARIARGGIASLGDAEGLELFERARALGAPFLLPVSLDAAVLRAAARAGALQPLLSGLFRAPARRAGEDSLSNRLAAMPEAERERAAVELVRTHVAAVLAHPSAAAIDPEAPFKDLGFDSLAAVELRNRLAQATGLQLPTTLVFDYPSAAATARFLASLASPSQAAAARVDGAIDGLRALLADLAGDERQQAGARLRSLLTEAEREAADSDSEAVERIQAASAEELLAIVDDEIGAR